MKVSITQHDYANYDVIDVDTGCRIPFVQEADDETGEFTIILPDWDKSSQTLKFIEKINEFGQTELVKFIFKGNIKIIKKETK